MTRRTFLRASLAAPAGGLAQSAGRRVIVAGAGLAGLSAAWELDHAGYDVRILEARTRPGGRVFTLRAPFSDGLHAEVGASRIQDSHRFTLKYARQFNLSLDPFWPTDGASITRVGGKRFVLPAGKTLDLNETTLPFSDQERKLGLRGSQAKYLFSRLGELGDSTLPDWPGPGLSRFEVPIREYLLAEGASEGIIRMVALGHDLAGMSALQFLRDAANGASTKIWFKIRGGNDQLPKAFAAGLASRIFYGAEIIRLEQDEHSVRAVYLQAGKPSVLTGDYLICALPLPVMRRVEVSPALTPEKR
ncbi:MAG TPA: FAD-dependent oxidoreductase, partial [Bryobacteraceae bacterium]|nr:FAD-dependent oxidoreductase [Bryobacteraceae bacterium]